MSLEQAQKNARENYNKLVNRCWEDESFKQELIAKPLETLESFYGKSLNIEAKGKTHVVVTDQTNPGVMYVNIPGKPNFDDMELTDAELEAIAGGGWYVHITGTTICVGTN